MYVAVGPYPYGGSTGTSHERRGVGFMFGLGRGCYGIASACLFVDKAAVPSGSGRGSSVQCIGYKGGGRPIEVILI